MTSSNLDKFPFTPLVIIGAGRSGTNALRDALVRLDDFGTWPCDEINPIWRHGNIDYPDDEIPPQNATPSVRRYIRGAFRRIWRQQGRPNFVVEKTCANALRVPFVDTVLPEARFIHIVRNGFDVVASAEKRWRGDLEIPGLPYFLAKARYAPPSDLPRYALSAIRTRLAVRTGRRKHLESWGPRFAGIDVLSEASIEELVARQWAACVTASDKAFAEIDPSRVFQLRYEDFTADAARTLSSILSWLGEKAAEEDITKAASQVWSSSVGKGRTLAETLPEEVKTLLLQQLSTHGYTT
ncbi:MAG: sulfotransferase [Gammaproteobacteria bacterium]|nr:sulfotransferase [Gammaproteobacteria bacterium]